MNQNSLWPDVAILGVAAIAVYLCDKFTAPVKSARQPRHVSRYLALNGLRGFLALFVFIHHATVWYLYLRTGMWEASAAYLYTHLGQNKVFLFFVISAFLFSTQLLNSRIKPFHWFRFYVSRVLRLAPLYFFMLAVAMVLTAVLSNFVLRESFTALLLHLGQWASFAILGTPNMNGIALTAIAGVAWTLPYEWFFYLTLPLLAVLLRATPTWSYILLGLVSTIGLYFWHPNLAYVSAFGSGALVAIVVKQAQISKFLEGKYGAIFAVCCVVLAATALPSGDHWLSRALLCAALAVVASKNTLCGVLSCRFAQALGERSYSIYLMHSLVLFIAFKFVVGSQASAALTATGHWLVVTCCTAVLIPLSYLTYRWIEQPAMRLAPTLSTWLQHHTTTGSGSSRMPKRS